jgi:hypothetical protein
VYRPLTRFEPGGGYVVDFPLGKGGETENQQRTYLDAQTRVPLQSTSHHSGSTKHNTRPIKDVFTQRGIIPIIFINLSMFTVPAFL